MSDSDAPEGENLAEWIRWLDERPESVRKIVKQRPPWKNYSLKGSEGHVYRILSYDEMDDDTVTVRVFAVTGPRREVFGIKPEDLSEAAR